MEDFVIDTEQENAGQALEIKKRPSKKEKVEERQEIQGEPIISCLKKEKIIVRYVPRQSGIITNPKHLFYGGMGEGSKRVFTVPKYNTTGNFVNVLTNSEKNFLEEYMGLEYNDLSVYRKNDNFWAGFRVSLTKGDTYLDLSDPEDYIRYKVLLANKDFIAPSLEELQDKPKATYQFVLINEADESKASMKQLSYNQRAYMKFGELQANADALKLIIETIDGRPIDDKTKLEFLQSKAGELILSDPKLFCKVAEDPYMMTKVLIRNAHQAGILAKKGSYYYLKKDNTPLCENNEEPTLSMAAKYLNAPKHQELKLSIEAQLE